MSSRLYVANWKMFLDVAESVEQVTMHFELLERLANRNSIVLCPSFTSLSTISMVVAQTNIHLAAQDCSPHNRGAFTGQISAIDLQRMGCTHALVGHSEQRAELGYSNQTIAQKVARLLEHGIIPIVCIGGDQKEMQQDHLFSSLQEQLDPVLEVACTHQAHAQKPKLCIAYEPLWAIGTDQTPSIQHIAAVFEWLKTYCHQKCHGLEPLCLYGGSVSQYNASALGTVPGLDGFLIGRASCDLQELEKIVDCSE